MIRCETIQHWLPWYISGQLSPHKIQRMAEHIADCKHCQSELAQVIELRHRLVTDTDAGSSPVERVWDAISPGIEGKPETHIDMGSFLVGLNLGFTAGSKKHPIQGDLRLLGRKVRIIGKQKKGA